MPRPKQNQLSQSPARTSDPTVCSMASTWRSIHVPSRLNGKRQERLPRSRNVRPTRAIFAEEESDETVMAVLTPGDQSLPPLVEVSLKLGTMTEEIRMVKPPSVDELWSWYEMTGNMEADPSWAKNWETAMSFATAIAEGSNTDVPNLKSKRLLEVGSGLGLVGIAAAKCAGADSVVFSDREPLAIHCALSSAAVSGMTSSPSRTSLSSAVAPARVLVVCSTGPSRRRSQRRSTSSWGQTVCTILQRQHFSQSAVLTSLPKPKGWCALLSLKRKERSGVAPPFWTPAPPPARRLGSSLCQKLRASTHRQCWSSLRGSDD